MVSLRDIENNHRARLKFRSMRKNRCTKTRGFPNVETPQLNISHFSRRPSVFSLTGTGIESGDSKNHETFHAGRASFTFQSFSRRISLSSSETTPGKCKFFPWIILRTVIASDRSLNKSHTVFSRGQKCKKKFGEFEILRILWCIHRSSSILVYLGQK